MKATKILLTVFLFGLADMAFSQEKIDLLILNKNYEEALQQIDKKISKNPEAQLFLKKGLVLNYLQNYLSAVEAFSNGLQYAPNNFDLNNEMAESLSLLGNNHDAVHFFEKAVLLEPENLAVKGKLGRTLINLQKLPDAYEIFTEIYAVDSTNAYWNKQYAFCAFKTGKKEQAVNLYEKVIEQNPRDYKSYFNLAHLYSADEQEKVVQLLEAGLEQFPEDPDFYLEFANFYFGRKQYDFATQNFSNYFQVGGDTVYKVQLNYGICSYLSGNEEKALPILQQCYLTHPDDAILLFYLGLCHKKLKDFETAERFMKDAIDMSYPDWLPEMYHHLGQIYGQQRKFRESVNALKKSHEFNPSNPEVLFEIATTFEEFNSNKTLALNYYKIYLKEAGEAGKNINYALERIERIKEDLFFEQ